MLNFEERGSEEFPLSLRECGEILEDREKKLRKQNENGDMLGLVFHLISLYETF
jgi:hypothetical protein